MSYCLNPDCQKPQNPDDNKFCLNCGSKLVLRERYRAIKIIGQGGFGRTFLAVDGDKPSKPQCVIKQFHVEIPDGNTDKAAELFDREAARLDELGKHPQIPELLAHFTQEGQQYLVQEFVDGENLAQLLAAEGTFKEDKIRHILNSLLPVLEFIHDRHIIHRDIKPENIIQSPSSELFLVDFGAAKYTTGTSLNKTGTLIGTPEFIAPEQARGKAVFASDIYSLGVACIHLMTGISPFDLFDVSEDKWVWRQFLVDKPVSQELGLVLDRCIENSPKNRYRLAREVIEAVNSREPARTSQIATGDRPTDSVTDANLRINLQSFEFEVITLEVTGKTGFLGGKTIIESNIYRRSAQYFTEEIGGGIELEIIAIPGGQFMMGSSDLASWQNRQRQVNIEPFFLSKYPVTQAQYKSVMSNNPSKFWGDNRPVEGVSIDDTKEFCAKLSHLTGKKYRLPSEAEWEYAARANTTTNYHFGDVINTDVANYKHNYTYGGASKGIDRQQTTDVGTFSANNFGLYDIHGNVWELCSDTWHDIYGGAPGGISFGNIGGDGNRSPIRGGSWSSTAQECACAYRYFAWRMTGISNNNIGFRVACDLG